MEEDKTEDVNIAEETTAGVSSSADETTQDSAGESNSEETLADGSARSDKTVPYERFAEANEKFDKTVSELKAEIENLKATSKDNSSKGEVDPTVEAKKAEAKALLKEMGFVSKEDLQRQKADEVLERDFKRLESQWDGKADPTLKFTRKEVIDFALEKGIGDPEMAFKLLKEKELTNFRIREAMKGSTGIKTEGSDGSGSQVGISDDDLKEAIAKGDKKAKDLFLTRIARNNFKITK